MHVPISDEREIEIFKKIECPLSIIEHCLAVKEFALSMVSILNIDVDMDLVREGALFHDIGRCKTQGINHAVEGAKLARNLGLRDSVIGIIERHIGSGITAEEAESFGLPKKDYLPVTVEEKIVSYADNLVDGTRARTFEKAMTKFKKTLGVDDPAVRRFKKMHEEIESWIKK